MEFHTLNLLLKYAREYGHGKIRIVGLSDTEHTICTFLFAHADSSQDDVATALKLDKTTVARALATLEDKAFVVRKPNPENRRKNMLAITEDGKKSISEVVDIYDEWLSRVSACLDADELRLFGDCCARLLSAAKSICEEKR